jgi:hypothetical protein
MKKITPLVRYNDAGTKLFSAVKMTAVVNLFLLSLTPGSKFISAVNEWRHGKFVSAVNDTGSKLVSAVNDPGSKFVSAVNDPGSKFVSAVNDAGSKFVSTVNDAGGKLVSAVNDPGSKFVSAVNDTGGKFELSMTPAVNLPPESTSPDSQHWRHYQIPYTIIE